MSPAPGASTAWSRGALHGAGVGLAMAVVEWWVVAVRLAQMNLPPMLEPLALSATVEIGLGAVAGALAAPLLRLRLGGLVHVALLAGLWVGAGLATAPWTPHYRMAASALAVGGLLLALLGLALGRWRRVAPGLVGALALGAAASWMEFEVAPSPGIRSDVVARVPAPSGAPDVVFVVLDTVRAQNVSAYGYARETTPSFDALAERGALFLDATAPSTWSLPSHASFFTGLFPSTHGAHNEHHYLRRDVPTLA